jgi:hypothetical protein
LNNATTKANYVRVNKTPLTRSNALGLGQKAVDETVSARFKIVPAEVPKSRIKRTLEYNDALSFNVGNAYKFRSFQVRKGNRQELGNTFIEKAQFRIDSPGEFSGITVKGWKARQGKRGFF